MKYAIVFLCMLKEHYVVGACIAANAHRCFIKRLNNVDIKLVIMCDDNIYKKYGDLLKMYFDSVKKMKLDTFNISEKFSFAKEKYADWVAYSTNKWKCLKLVKYDKILFLDIDMLPAKLDFYNIFNLTSPAVLRCRVNKIFKCNEMITDFIGNSYYDFVTEYALKQGTIDGGIVLLTPSKTTYKQYKKFINKTFEKAMYSASNSFPDETSLFYFLMKNFKVYNICNDYSRIPWTDNNSMEDINKYINSTLLYNYNSFYKPWIKPRSLMYKEELLWHDIYDTMEHNELLDKLYKNSIMENYEQFTKLDFHKKKQRYNNVKNLKNINKNNYNDRKLFGSRNNDYGILIMDDIKKCLK